MNEQQVTVIRWVDKLAAERDAALARAERAEQRLTELEAAVTELAPTPASRIIRCSAEHPTNPSVVSCLLDLGHDGDHMSDTGCAGSGVSWALATRERYASLDQLKPGDRIAWTSGGQAEVRTLEDIWPVGPHGSAVTLRWRNGVASVRVNASLLVRRADTPPQQEAG